MAAALQQSGPRHQTGFFAASSFRTLKRPVSSTSGIGEVVKIIILDLTLSLSVLCQYCYQAYIKLKTGVSRKIICAVIAELEPLFSTEYSLYERLTNHGDSQLGIRQTFSQKWTETFTSRKTTCSCCNDKIQTFRWKLEFWKTYILNHEFDSFLVLKNFSNEIGSDIYECNFLDIYSEIC